MPVGNKRARRMIEELGVERQVLAVIVEGLGVLQIALMLRKDRLAVLDQAERRL